jgi:hypothetical protein
VRIGPCHARREEGVVTRMLRCILSSHHQVSNRRTVNFGQTLTVVTQNDRDFIKLSCQHTFSELVPCILHIPWLILNRQFTAAVGYVQTVSLDCRICADSQLAL